MIIIQSSNAYKPAQRHFDLPTFNSITSCTQPYRDGGVSLPRTCSLLVLAALLTIVLFRRLNPGSCIDINSLRSISILRFTLPPGVNGRLTRPRLLARWASSSSSVSSSSVCSSASRLVESQCLSLAICATGEGQEDKIEMRLTL